MLQRYSLYCTGGRQLRQLLSVHSTKLSCLRGTTCLRCSIKNNVVYKKNLTLQCKPPPHHLPPCGHVPFNNMFFMCSLSYNRETCPNIFNTWYSTVSTPLAPLTRSVSDQALPSISSCPCCPASELRELMRELLLLLVLCWVLLQNIFF